MTTRVLFVCDGNTCRSPMAAALANRRFGGSVKAESGGIDVGEQSARPLAVQVMREEFGIDIGSHRPRDVEHLAPREFDHVVAMKPHIARCLHEALHVPPTRLLVWDVDDPAGGDLQKYRDCIALIAARLDELSERLGIQ